MEKHIILQNNQLTISVGATPFPTSMIMGGRVERIRTTPLKTDEYTDSSSQMSHEKTLSLSIILVFY